MVYFQQSEINVCLFQKTRHRVAHSNDSMTGRPRAYAPQSSWNPGLVSAFSSRHRPRRFDNRFSAGQKYYPSWLKAICLGFWLVWDPGPRTSDSGMTDLNRKTPLIIMQGCLTCSVRALHHLDNGMALDAAQSVYL
jgi:hypothetical protein